MLCEKCTGEIDLVACGACGRKVAQIGPFCYYCGNKLDKEAGKTAAGPGQEFDEVPDFSDRILCSDGTCIGVINEQGVCKVCGKPYTPEP
jgi:predicted amidophosphoribosyltransferase